MQTASLICRMSPARYLVRSGPTVRSGERQPIGATATAEKKHAEDGEDWGRHNARQLGFQKAIRQTLLPTPPHSPPAAEE